MIIKEHNKIRKAGDKWTALFAIGRGPLARSIELELELEEVEMAFIEPVKSTRLGSVFWIFKNYLLRINERYLEIDGSLNDENILRINRFISKITQNYGHDN